MGFYPNGEMDPISAVITGFVEASVSTGLKYIADMAKGEAKAKKQAKDESIDRHPVYTSYNIDMGISTIYNKLQEKPIEA